MPEYQPLIERRPPSSKKGETGHRLRSADDHERAIDGQAALNGAHRLAVGHGGENGLGAAQLGQFGGRVLRLAVDVMACPELLGERFFVLSAGDGDGLKTHLRGELDAQMAKPAQPEHGDEIAGARRCCAGR